MKKVFAGVLVVLITGVLTYSFSSYFLRASVNEPVSEPAAGFPGKPNRTMTAFTSEAAIKEYLREIAERQKRDADRRRADYQTDGATSSNLATTGAPASSPAAKAESKNKAGADDESVTNNQHAGVDEGGIVKMHGDHLVILRRGRLFTVKVGDNALRPVDTVDAYAPGVNPSNDWYDEMLVSGNTVVVIGYSYGRGGTEINLFDIDARGGLDYRSTHHLRSNDYYSSRNYASRLVGNKLVFYTPQYLSYSAEAVKQFPAVRRWRKSVRDDEFRSVVEPTRVYRPAIDLEAASGQALHTVTVCDLASAEFSCKGTAVLGAPGRVFYVSSASVYVWTTDWRRRSSEAKQSSMLYKMPLDGSAPSALGVTGAPVDQFSFLESDDNHLNVLVRSNGRGEQMWGSEIAQGDVALLRVPAARFSDGSESASIHLYSELPRPSGYTFQNRFVGDYLLYGTGSGWGRPEHKHQADLYAVHWKTSGITNLSLRHGVDRIEQLGGDAVVVGTNGSDLIFSPIRLGGSPTVMESYTRKNASQGETRSHGFFYKAEDDDSGILGLPIARQGRSGYRHLVEDSAAIVFLRNDNLTFDPVGELEAKNTSTNDKCRASCVDWYGNARPIFVRGRVFALLGYELVEGRLDDKRIREVRRVNYSPGSQARLRPSPEINGEE